MASEKDTLGKAIADPAQGQSLLSIIRAHRQRAIMLCFPIFNQSYMIAKSPLIFQSILYESERTQQEPVNLSKMNPLDRLTTTNIPTQTSIPTLQL